MALQEIEIVTKNGKKKMKNGIAGDEVFHEQGGRHVPGRGECFQIFNILG